MLVYIECLRLHLGRFLWCLPPLNVNSLTEINVSHLVANAIADAKADAQCERALNLLKG